MKRTLVVGYLLINHCIIQAQTNSFPATGNVGVGTTTPDAKLALRGGMSIGSELGNADPRPGITAGTLPGELRGISKNGSGLDDGFLRLSAGGGANPLTKSFVDLSGYAATTNTDRNLNIVMGTSGLERFRINSAGNVGLGNPNPQATLHVGKRVSSTPGVEGSVDRIAIQPWFHTGGPWLISSRDIPSSKAYLDIKYGAVRLYTMDHTGNVGIGTTHLTEKLSVKGKIRAQEIKVEANNGTNWPDYVFQKDYKLRSLAEVEKHIDEKGYLPEVPSAKEVEKEGIALGTNQALLLKKIEELTLYMIEQDKINKAQAQQIKAQAQLLETLQRKIVRINNK
ncbi:MAG TPA: hypothetical protein VL943_11060 [Niabella sp.]|nr:hypothetical protein [Niabella sp.]